MSRIKGMGALAAPALLLSLCVAQPAAASTDKCAPQIYGQANALEAKIIAAFKACDAAYRADQKAIAAGKGTDYTKSAGKCQIQLVKNLGLGNGSQMDKVKAKLDSFVPSKCTDTDLLLLGHLPTGTFGDLWSRYIVMNALNHAYQLQLANIRDTINAFQNMACAPKEPGPDCAPGHATTCAACDSLVTAPCAEHSCTYLTPGGSGFQLISSNVGTINGTLLGSSSFTLCQYKGPGSQSVNPNNEYIVTGGGAGKGINPVVITGLGFACPIQMAAEGYISCPGGSDGTVNYQTCQDSNVPSKSDADKAGGCGGVIGTPDVCTPGTEDKVDGGFNGGACVKYAKAGAAAGAAFIINSTQLNTPLSVLSQLGPDGQPCTADDTEPLAVTGSIGLSTGTSSSHVLNFGTSSTDQSDSATVTGNNFTCGNIQSSNLAGGKISGAFPATGQPTIGDSTTTFSIQCQ